MALPSGALAAYRSVQADHLPRVRWPAAALGGVLTYLGQAQRAMAQRDVPAAHEALVQSQQILALLRGGLDRGAAPELVDQLDAVYAFVQQGVGRANLHKDPEALHSVIPVVATLREAWEAAAERELAGGGRP